MGVEVESKSLAVFRACCHTDDNTQLMMHRPFVIGNWVYATNGHIICRMPVNKCGWVAKIIPQKPGERLPPCNTLGWEMACGERVPLPDSGEEVLKKCTGCGGKGVVSFKTCPKCEGEGVTDCLHCGSKFECEDCDGTGRIYGQFAVNKPCEACDGKGMFVIPKAVEVGPHYLNKTYIDLLKSFGVGVVRWRDRNICHWSTGDIEGLLMAVTATRKEGM